MIGWRCARDASHGAIFSLDRYISDIEFAPWIIVPPRCVPLR